MQITESVSTRRRTSLPRAIALLASVIVVTGCGTKYSSTPATQPVESRVPALQPLPDNTPAQKPVGQIITPTAVTPPVEAVRSLPAAIVLRKQAAKAAAADNHGRALGLLERALRISPDDPLTFQALAQSHLAMNQPGQALQLVRRGLSLNPTNAQRQSLVKLAEQCQAML